MLQHAKIQIPLRKKTYVVYGFLCARVCVNDPVVAYMCYVAEERCEARVEAQASCVACLEGANQADVGVLPVTNSSHVSSSSTAQTSTLAVKAPQKRKEGSETP
uniref:AlNc14C106G6229 protein n=1 Tax=Albugo laibachii Nc14 TaxID=890382 RepID=F0WI22_9STRA|nr:AlNc14C106G6229 [Albugo laibachii Nc14]|eukprot:CCA20899.1 AlNc14C106G6229 [Albugo laibachii Nc14]